MSKKNMEYKSLADIVNKFYGLDSSLDNPFYESENGFNAEFAVPGIELSQISVKTSANRLRIEAVVTKEQEKKGIRGFSLLYSFPNPSADLSNVEANLNLGILSLSIPKKADAGYKKVSIKSS